MNDIEITEEDAREWRKTAAGVDSYLQQDSMEANIKLVCNLDVTSMIYKGWSTIRQYDIGNVLMRYVGRGW